MKALVVRGTGDVRLEDMPDLPLPEGECRIRVWVAGICRTDLELVRGYMGFTGIPGHEFVGTVVDGPRALAGRRVVGEINVPRDLRRYEVPGFDPRHEPERTVLGILDRPGALAETLTLPAPNLLVVPDGLADEEAVFTEPLAAALSLVERLPIPPAAAVLVVGDGKLGLLVTQVLLLRGHRVTLQGHHDRKLALARSWGAATGTAGPASHDWAVECTGSPRGFEAALDSLRPRGTLALKSTYAPGQEPPLDAARIVVNEITLVGSRCGRFEPALRLLAAGRVDVRPLIEETVGLHHGLEALERATRPGALKVLVHP